MEDAPAQAFDPIPLRAVPERDHWINTIVGILDQAFFLTDEEQVFVIEIVARLLDSLNVPDRSDPQSLPAPLALEISCGFYTNLLAGPRVSGLIRPVRHVSSTDIIVSLETWREALLGMLTTAHPDLSPLERIITAKVLADLLDAIGVPDRKAAFFPDDVVRLSREIDTPFMP